MKNNTRLLMAYVIKYQLLTNREINSIKKSNKELNKKQIVEKSSEINYADWALAKCNLAIRNREAVDIKMLTAALPAISSFQVLKRLHDQLEDLTIPYEQLEPIYAALVELSKNFVNSLQYFQLVQFNCAYYEQLLEHQYLLAKNPYAIDRIGKTGLHYIAFGDALIENASSDSYEIDSNLMADDAAVKWAERVVEDILKSAKSVKEAKLALNYVRNADDYFPKMYYSATQIIDRMLKLAESESEIEYVLICCDETIYGRKEALMKAIKQS